MTTPPLPVGFPMPRDITQITDVDNRVRLERQPGRRYPWPVPNGWFVVARSDELGPSGVLARYYFARPIVIFRTESGEAHTIDAYCPHQGAHIAVGGRVEGECIRCPFHGWAFDGDSGRCTEIPYGDTERIPARAVVRSFPTVERNQMVWAWYHADDKPPFYEIPDVWEFDDPDWLPVEVREFTIDVAAQDMAENSVDFAHAKFTHGAPAVPEDDFFVDGMYKRSSGRGGQYLREGYGLGLGIVRSLSDTEYNPTNTFLSSTTPIDEERVHVRWMFTTPRSKGEDAPARVGDNLLAAVAQDVPIWENKIFREHPVLVRSERPVMEFRQWAKQFYSHYEEAPPETDSDSDW